MTRQSLRLADLVSLESSPWISLSPYWNSARYKAVSHALERSSRGLQAIVPSAFARCYSSQLMAAQDEPSGGALRRGWPVRVTTERVTLPNGQPFEIDIVKHPGASAIVPFTCNASEASSNSADREVLLIRQYRHAAGGTIYEVPAGKLDSGETPEACALRELEEETGRRAGRIEKLGWIFTTPGFCDEVIHLFAAFDLETVPPRPEDDEVIELVPMPFARALELVWNGELNDAKSALALLHAARHLGFFS